MRCDEVMELMQRELDLDLSADEFMVMNEHIHTCTECQSLYASLKQLSLDLENLPAVDPPVSIVDQILPHLATIEDTGSHPKLDKAVHWKKWSMVAGGLAAVICVWVLTEKTFIPEMEKNDLQMQRAAQEQQIIAKTPELPNKKIAENHIDSELEDNMKSFNESSSVAKSDKVGEEQTKTIQPPKKYLKEEVALDHKAEPNAPKPQRSEEPTISETEIAIAKQDPQLSSSFKEGQADQTDQVPSTATTEELSDLDSPSIAATPEEEYRMSHVLVAPMEERMKNQEGMEQSLASPSGHWFARLEANSLVVLNQEGIEIYRSHSWKEGMEVQMSWIDDSHLEYRLELIQDQSQLETWRINLEEGQEHKQ